MSEVLINMSAGKEKEMSSGHCRLTGVSVIGVITDSLTDISAAMMWKNAHVCLPVAMDLQSVCEHRHDSDRWPVSLHLWEIPLMKEKRRFCVVSQRCDTLY